MLTLTRLTPRKKCHVMKNNYFILITSLPSQSIDIHFGKYSTLVFRKHFVYPCPCRRIFWREERRSATWTGRHWPCTAQGLALAQSLVRPQQCNIYLVLAGAGGWCSFDIVNLTESFSKSLQQRFQRSSVSMPNRLEHTELPHLYLTWI